LALAVQVEHWLAITAAIQFSAVLHQQAAEQAVLPLVELLTALLVALVVVLDKAELLVQAEQAQQIKGALAEITFKADQTAAAAAAVHLQ
jgi:hypothetical protein